MKEKIEIINRKMKKKILPWEKNKKCKFFQR